jgi:hypothetical protein
MWNCSPSLWQGSLLPGSLAAGTFSEELRAADDLERWLSELNEATDQA